MLNEKPDLVRPQPWKPNISQLCYINVPRICELAEQHGIQMDLSAYQEGKTLYSLGWNLNRLMSQFQQLISYCSVEAIPLESVLEFPRTEYLGSAVGFEGARFRTSNVPMPTEREAVFSAKDIQNSQIYLKAKNKWRFVLPIDPNWITTSTAFVLFRPPGGYSTFSGLARITNIDHQNRVLFATPWLIGIPKGWLDE